MEGLVLLLTIIGTAGVGLTVLRYRDLIWPERYPAAPAKRQPRPRPRPIKNPRRVEMEAKLNEMISSALSGSTAPEKDAETISLETISILVRAGLVNETVAIETTFKVHAGGGKEYKRLQARYKEIAKASTPTEHKVS